MSRARDVADRSIVDDAVTLAKMASGTDGQIITYDASGNPTAVGPGTDGQVLTSTGAGSPPAFESLAGGTTSYEFVSYTQVPSPDNQTFTIDNVFTDTYKTYRVIISAIIGASNMDTSVVNLRFLDNSGTILTAGAYDYVSVSRDSNSNDRNIHGASASSANLSQNFGAESSKKQALCADLIFTGTRTDSMYTRCEGTVTHDYGTDALVVGNFATSYRTTSGGNTKVRGFALLGGGSSNQWTQNSDGGVYVYGINHA